MEKTRELAELTILFHPTVLPIGWEVHGAWDDLAEITLTVMRPDGMAVGWVRCPALGRKVHEIRFGLGNRMQNARHAVSVPTAIRQIVSECWPEWRKVNEEEPPTPPILEVRPAIQEEEK